MDRSHDQSAPLQFLLEHSGQLLATATQTPLTKPAHTEQSQGSASKNQEKSREHEMWQAKSKGGWISLAQEQQEPRAMYAHSV
jgi:hypothetical protein